MVKVVPNSDNLYWRIVYKVSTIKQVINNAELSRDTNQWVLTAACVY